jgi:hypothetical protein
MGRTNGAPFFFFLVIPPLQDICWYDGMIRVCVCSGLNLLRWLFYGVMGGDGICGREIHVYI